MLDHILKKLFSGKWLLTLACAIAFVYAVMNQMLAEATIAAIIVGVFKDYFQRDKDVKHN